MRKWRIEDSEELYNITGWGASYFGINEKGHVGEYGYKAQNFIIYPIKVNQMRPVVEEIIGHGKKFNLGLEAGSKPELHAVIAVNTDSDSLIICNGYKDESYIELALLAQKMGKRIWRR